MTNETRERIRAYKKLLPDMRERVLGVALLLLTSVAMMVTASFAWITLSRAPEVTGMQTTVAANGNLEIALASGSVAQVDTNNDGIEEEVYTYTPGDSKVGDSSATAGQTITGANITWGNLINLSDPSYGLENLVLRPAQLNTSSLKDSPLYGAVYLGDGRIEKLNSKFGYGTWDNNNQRFVINDQLGVRAISSVILEVLGEEQKKVYALRDKADEANLAAGALYSAITNNKTYMDTLATIMGLYMTANMNPSNESLSNPTVQKEDVENLRDLFADFIEVYDAQFLAWAELANYRLYLLQGVEVKKSAEDIKTATEKELKDEGTTISNKNTAKSDYDKIVDGYNQLVEKAKEGAVKWKDSGFAEIVNKLMNTGACTLDGTPVSSIGASNASGYLSGTHEAVITNGVLYNFETINGAHCDVKGLSVSATVERGGFTVPASVKVNISTNAEVPASFIKDLAKAEEGVTLQGTKTAQDTYGLALDLWVRTNAAGSFLTLEGNVLTKSETVRATGKDIEGNVVELYVLTRYEEIEDENGQTKSEPYTIDLYKIVEEDDSVTWRDATSHEPVELKDDEEPTAKMEELVTVIGYEGENRVWEDANAWEQNAQLSLDSTTQGAGSCYVYYSDTPEDQARSLKLLEAMKVAFVDNSGKLLASAIMDTERYFAENGRVTVPMKLDSDSLEVGKTGAGESIYAITALAQNQPMHITAIVYLDGTKLDNKDVLAASDIQGQMNIQFGSSVTLSHMEDEKLLGATRSVSATVDKKSFSYDDSIENNTPMTTKVTVTVDGDQPKKVEAFFLRKISDTQGSREKSFVLTQQGGNWTYDYIFTAPGVYILRSVQLDGQTYDLGAPFPEITVEGFTVESLDCTEAVGGHVSVLTAEPSSSVELKLRFASDDPRAMPKTVQGRYIRKADGVAVNVNFKYNADGTNKGFWTGQATFISSGEYTLEFLVLDGKYTELPFSLQQTAMIYLGMKVAVYTESPQEFLYEGASMPDNRQNLYMQVKIMDDTGKEMEGLKNTHLYYRLEGSTSDATTMDAPMTWDGKYYTCTFRSKIGTYKFAYVTVGDNSTITVAETYPVFRIRSPLPTKYEGFVEKDYVFDPTGKTTMDINLRNSSAALTKAVIKNLGDGKVYEVGGKIEISNQVETRAATEEMKETQEVWSFKIPTTDDGKQDGNWQLETVKIWNCCDEEQNSYTEDNPMEVSVDGYITKAVTTIQVITEGLKIDAEEKNAVSGVFMQTHTISGLKVTIRDFEHQEVQGLSGVELTYVYGNDSEKYGGYASTSLTNALADFKVELTKNGMVYSQAKDITVQYAGSYKPVLKYYLENGYPNGVEADAENLEFTISSVKPTVTVSAVSPSNSINTKITWSKNWRGALSYTLSDPKTNSIDPETNTVTAYAQAVTSGGVSVGNGDAGFIHPKVKFTVAGVDAKSTVKFTIPAGNANAKNFSQTGNGQSGDITLGAHNNEIYSSWSIYTYSVHGYLGHGNQIIKQITIERESVTYTVTLDKPINIVNPSSIDKTS